MLEGTSEGMRKVDETVRLISGEHGRGVAGESPFSAKGDTNTDVTAENPDTRLLKILYAYFRKHPGDPRMSLNELVRISQAERADVTQCLYGLREKKRTEFDLTEGSQTGLVWLTQIGMRIAEIPNNPPVRKVGEQAESLPMRIEKKVTDGSQETERVRHKRRCRLAKTCP